MAWLTANEPLTEMPRSWYAETAGSYRPSAPLTQDLRAEVCVVGGGLTGLAAAMTLAEAGRDVILLEAAQAGWGASGRNGGQLSSGFNWDGPELATSVGLTEARALWALAEEGKALGRDWMARFAPEADYRPGVIYGARDRAGAQALAAEAAWRNEHFDYGGVQAISATDIAERTGSRVFEGGILDQGAGFCNPLAYSRGLARALHATPARVFEGTQVLRISEGAPHRLNTPLGSVQADWVILATNGYHDGLSPVVADRVLPINNYIAVTEPLGNAAPMARPVAVADDRFVVNYWWQSRDGRLVYGGGESYGRRFPADIPGLVRRNLRRVYPALGDVRFTHAWGGTLAVTPSRLPYAGRPGTQVLSVGGYSGLGLALSGVAGRAMARVVLGDGTDFERLARLPVPRLPGGRWLGPWVTGAAMGALALRDRLGI